MLSKKVSSKKILKKELVLLQHQISPVYDLIYKNPKKHGLLLYYGLGTGKTLSGISLILNLPGRNINIVCPEDLKFVWEYELSKVPEIKNKIRYYSYEKYQPFLTREFKDEVIIFDEVHNIVPIIKRNPSEILSKINSSYKVLCLTGTPIYSGFTDLVYLVNICAGKQLVPYNDTTFKDTYFKVNKFRSLNFGYILPIGILSTSIISNFSQVMSLSTISGFEDKMPGFLLNISKKLNTPLYKLTKNPEYWDTMDIALLSLSSPSAIVLILSMILGIITKLSVLYGIKYTIDDYTHLDTKKFVNDINNYVFLYKNTYINKDSPFPSVKTIINKVSYNTQQLNEWIKLTQGRLDKVTLEKLNVTESKDIDYHISKLDPETYKKNGVIIGNLSFVTPTEKLYSLKFHKLYEKAKNKRAVVYSSFTKNGILEFKEFLQSKGAKFMYLDTNQVDKNLQYLKAFKNSKKPVFLLLHPNFYHGISVFGAEQLHILEPIPELAKKQQVCGRVVRYLSHSHLPENERSVEIHEWCCVLGEFIDILKAKMISMKNWFQFNPEVFFTEKFERFSQEITPDSIVLNDHQHKNKLLTEIDEALSKSKKVTETCCIKFPGAAQQKACLTTMAQCIV